MAAKGVKANINGGKESQACEDLVREVAILSRLPQHRNVVPLFGVVRSPRLLLLMEYVEGQSLSDYIWEHECRHGYGNWKPDSMQALAWGLGLFRGLAFLHSQNPVVMHRDLKPGNLMLLEDKWNLKIIDFGLSRPLGKIGMGETREDGTHRLFGKQLTMATGTFRYMAPEVFAGEHYSEKADVYTAALILWQTNTGLKPFYNEEKSLNQEVERSKKRPPLDKVSIDGLKPLLEQAWHVDPTARPGALALSLQLESLGAAVPDEPELPDSVKHGKCVVQ